MEVQVFVDSEAAAYEAASWIAREARAVVAARGRFALAVSGGRTPWIMLHALAAERIPWERVHLFQVDERVAPAGHLDRNLTHIRENLLEHAPVRPDQIYAMPVESSDLEAAAGRYAQILQQIAGSPAVLDLVHLGLGSDGHTASLVPGDPAREVTDRDVALTEEYQGHRRMTLTYSMLNRSRRILWLVTGSDKAEMLVRLRNCDVSIPAGRVRCEQALIIADRAAADLIRDNDEWRMNKGCERADRATASTED